jgi:DNA-binding XRE family transcriptional regulator
MFNRGHILRALREQHGWSQADLARKAGVAVVTVNRAEQNKANVTDDTWRRLALAVNTSPDWLMRAHADPMIGSGQDVTHPVPATVYGEAASPPPVAMTPHAAAKLRVLALVTALDDHIAAEVEGPLWRLIFRAKMKPGSADTPPPAADAKPAPKD